MDERLELKNLSKCRKSRSTCIKVRKTKAQFRRASRHRLPIVRRNL